MTQTTKTPTITQQRQQRAQTSLALVLLLAALVALAEAQPTRVSSGLRFRRHATIAHGSSAAELLEQGDEQALKRHLPYLIAQAHKDKQVERALLRMLIQASLRADNAGSAGSWQLDASEGEGNNLAQYNQANQGSIGEFVPIRTARFSQQQQQQQQPDAGASMSQLGDLAADLEAQLAGAGELAAAEPSGPLQSYTSLDKREYIKPCSFNAISCVRTPFGRRIK